jgi:nucleoprotein TPR
MFPFVQANALTDFELCRQNDYERELSQHAMARTELRQARSEAEDERRNRLAAEDKLSSVKKESDGLRSEHEKEKASLQEALEGTEKRLKEAQMQNDLLHSQLQDLGALAEKNVASRIAAAAGEADASESDPGDNKEIKALTKTMSELRQIVRILRTDKEMMQAQVDAAKRTAEREKAAGTVTKRSLDEARAELQVLTNSSSTKYDDPDAKNLATKLQAAEDQLTLLRDSNQLLRDEADKLKQSLRNGRGNEGNGPGRKAHTGTRGREGFSRGRKGESQSRARSLERKSPELGIQVQSGMWIVEH